MSEPLSLDPIAEAERHWRRHGWPDAATGMAAVTSIMRAHQIVLARVEAVLRPHRLTFARYEVLMLLSFSRTGTLPMKLVGSRLQVHPTSVTNAVDRLQDAGLVRREPHPDDARSLLVALTDSGRDVARAATTDLNAAVFSQPGLSPAGTAELVRVLTDLRRGAGDFT